MPPFSTNNIGTALVSPHPNTSQIFRNGFQIFHIVLIHRLLIVTRNTIWTKSSNIFEVRITFHRRPSTAWHTSVYNAYIQPITYPVFSVCTMGEFQRKGDSMFARLWTGSLSSYCVHNNWILQLFPTQLSTNAACFIKNFRR